MSMTQLMTTDIFQMCGPGQPLDGYSLWASPATTPGSHCQTSPLSPPPPYSTSHTAKW
jgi:hypothetical protein